MLTEELDCGKCFKCEKKDILYPLKGYWLCYECRTRILKTLHKTIDFINSLKKKS